MNISPSLTRWETKTAFTRCVQGLTPTILADTNRDGLVDVEGDSDLTGKTEWTDERGALFLANIGDTDRRCAQFAAGALDRDLERCHDASDDVLRSPQYLAPLFTLPIDDLSWYANGSVRVADSSVASKVRLFVKPVDGEQWEYFGANRTFKAAELRHGLELGIDGRDVRRPEWDGRVTVNFTVHDGQQTASDSVALRVAPVLTHHTGQATERVFVTGAHPDGYSAAQAQFVSDVKKNAADAGIAAPVYEFEGAYDIWTQDFFETGYTSMPGPDGAPIVLRIMMRSSQAYRFAGREVFTGVRETGVGAVQSLGDGWSIDSTGNLETIPPYTHNGRTYPAGRIIMGQRPERNDTPEPPVIFKFLEAQEAQVPLLLNTEWLVVGHVDEFLQFLPVDSERGWVLLADDPAWGMRLLEDAAASGHGHELGMPRPSFDYDELDCVNNMTISEVLAQEDFAELNAMSSEYIDANLDILRRETGITDDEIIRIPAIFYAGGRSPCVPYDSRSRLTGGPDTDSDDDVQVDAPFSILEAATPVGLQRRQEPGVEKWRVYAYYPGIINGVVLNSTAVLAPTPWGPIIDGVDILAAAAEEAYASVNYTVVWQDDFSSHHKGMGEIHCGTNVWRTADDQWW
jgi:protein-arginine deiminase